MAIEDIPTERRAVRPNASPVASALGADIRDVIFDNGVVAIEYVHGGTPQSAVIFSFSPDGFLYLQGYGYQERELRAAGFDVVAVKQSAAEGYISLPPDIIEIITQQLPAYRVKIAVGAESAGFAVLKLCGGNADIAIVALSPRNDGVQEAAQPLPSEAYILYDPYSEIDVANCDVVLAQFPRAMLVPLHHAGHPSRFAAEQCGALSGFLQSLANGAPENPKRYIRMNRRSLPTVLYTLGYHALNRRHLPASQAILKMAFELNDVMPVVMAYSRSLATGGRLPDAIDLLEKYAATHSTNGHLWALMANYEELAGSPANALNLIRRAIEILPDFEGFHVVERRLLKNLYDDLFKQQQMTHASLNKARAELSLSHGHSVKEFKLSKLLLMLLFPLAIMIGLAISASTLSLI